MLFSEENETQERVNLKTITRQSHGSAYLSMLSSSFAICANAGTCPNRKVKQESPKK